MAFTFDESPLTATGVEACAVVPFPNWPLALSPQQSTPPEVVRAHVSLKLCSDPWTIQRGIQLAKLGLAELSGHAVAKAVPARVGVVAYYEWVTLTFTLTFTTAHGSSGSEDYRPLRQTVKRHRPFSFGVFRGWFVGVGAKTVPPASEIMPTPLA